ncbi:MAG: O-antigen ligase family protein [Thermomicrobiales bacterium]
MIGSFDLRAIRQPAIVAAAAAAFLFLLFVLADGGLLLFLAPLLVALSAGLLLARVPWAGFAFLLLSVPFQRFGSEGTALPATLTQMVFPIALAGTLLTLYAERRTARGHIILLPYSVLVAVMVASSIQAQSLGAAWSEIARWFVAIAAFWMALQLVAGRSDRRLVGFVALLAAGGVFEATIGVVQSVIGFGPFAVSSGVSRAFGTFGRPNSFAGYLEMTFFPTAALALWYASETIQRFRFYRIERLRGFAESQAARRSLVSSALAFAGFAASGAIILSGITASLSRGALLGVAVGGLGVMLLLSPFSRFLVAIGGLAAVALLLAGQAGLVPDSYRERVADSVDQIRPIDVRTVTVTDENFATVERLAHWQTGIEMYRDNPALGVGIGNFNTRVREYSIRPDFRNSQGHAHNYYIHTLAETGLLGLLAYLTLLGSVVILALRVLLMTTFADGLPRMIVLGAFGSVVAVATHNLVEDLHVLNLGIIISLLWVLIIAGHERLRAGQTTAS